MQSFTAWRHNLLAISAAAAAAGAATSGRDLERHRGPPTTSAVIDGALSLRFDHCRLPTALLMSQPDGSDLNNTGESCDALRGFDTVGWAAGTASGL